MQAAARRLREGVSGLATLAAADLNTVWRSAATTDRLTVALRDILPPLVDTYGAAAGTLAADWYDDLREKAAARRRFRAIPADIKDAGAQALIGWAATEAQDVAAFQTLIVGGTQRRIANFARVTVTTSSVQDPAARGWQRVGVGSCEFCAMLLDRGAVYTEASADFEAHDHCRCMAEPAF